LIFCQLDNVFFVFLGGCYSFGVIYKARKTALYAVVGDVGRLLLESLPSSKLLNNGAPCFIYKLAGCDKNRRISGCGMDMLFAAQYNLFRALCPGKRYQDSMARYNSL